MWCTRWFLPLLLLPLPTAPPYFLILFLFSLTMHAKPCFYCIVLLTTLFITSCYWQPFPLDSLLTTPWSDNITTFAGALNQTLPFNYTQPLPTVIRAVDRCWCDFSSGGFFEPFNVTNWEHLSVQRISNDLTRQASLEDNSTSKAIGDLGESGEHEAGVPTTESLSVASPRTAPSASKFWWRLLPSKIAHPSAPDDTQTTNGARSDDSSMTQTSDPSPTPLTGPPAKLPALRKEYDLRPYGVGMIVDLGWSR